MKDDTKENSVFMSVLNRRMLSKERHANSMFINSLLLAVVLAGAVLPVHADTIRWLTQTQSNNSQYPVEMAGIEAVEDNDISVVRSEFQALGINTGDALKLVNAGTFQLATTQVGLVARDDPFLEGIDLIGVSTDMAELRVAVDAYREAFNNRLGEKYGVKALAIWPFGPQIFLCNHPLESLQDMDGLRVRSNTGSMSMLLEELGATPLTLSFPDVYPTLERGLVSCGVTSPTSSNTGKWPEVTTHLYPLSVSGSVQAHLVNLNWLEGLSEEKRNGLESAMAAMEDQLWELANSTNNLAQSCSTGGECESNGLYTSYSMTLVPVSSEDRSVLTDILVSKILPEWGARCEASYPECKAIWNETIGAAAGLEIK